MLTKERKKQLDIDLWIIVIVSFLILGIYGIFNQRIIKEGDYSTIPIVLRVLFVGVVFQFGLAGLGITIVTIMRKESFLDHGLTVKKIIPTVLLSALCCVPEFMYYYLSGSVHGWFPFMSVKTTAEVMASGFPSNVLGMLITLICWGFFEGFNYVVISDKINERYPSKYRFWDWGAFSCAIMCILVHGAIGLTPDAVAEMLGTLILIYGMLLVRRETGNAWGCVLIFIFYWNAI